MKWFFVILGALLVVGGLFKHFTTEKRLRKDHPFHGAAIIGMDMSGLYQPNDFERPLGVGCVLVILGLVACAAGAALFLKLFH